MFLSTSKTEKRIFSSPVEMDPVGPLRKADPTGLGGHAAERGRLRGGLPPTPAGLLCALPPHRMLRGVRGQDLGDPAVRRRGEEPRGLGNPSPGCGSDPREGEKEGWLRGGIIEVHVIRNVPEGHWRGLQQSRFLGVGLPWPGGHLPSAVRSSPPMCGPGVRAAVEVSAWSLGSAQ